MFWTQTIILGILTLSHCQRIDDDMTDGEIATIFRTTRHAVPRYEVVRVMTGHSLFSRGLEIEYTAFGQKMYEYLQPLDGDLFKNDTPVWLATGHKNKTVTYKKMKDGIVGIAAKSFTSPLRHSALVVRRFKGRTSPKYDGYLHHFTIRSLSPRLQAIVRRKRGIEPSSLNQTATDENFHVIMKSDLLEKENEVVKSMNGKIGKVLNSSNETNKHKTKREVADVIYPTIMVVTDYERIATPTNNEAYIAEIVYQIAFWNAVDLRFRAFNETKVRLRIAGLIIGQNPEAAPWMRKSNNETNVDGNRALQHKMNYWASLIQRGEFEEVHYDFIVTLTQSLMVYTLHKGEMTRMAGLTRIGGICSKARYEFYAAGALVEDDGGFIGVLTSAHEIGHILGFLHDPEDGPCGVEHGYIMQPSISEPAKNNLHWSPCHLQELPLHRSHGLYFCSKNPEELNSTGEPIDTILPGFLLDDHRQCQARGFSYACEQTPAMCQMLRCFYAGIKAITHGGWSCHDTEAAAEGTACDRKKRCIDGVCKCTDHKCIVKDNIWSELNGYHSQNMNLSMHA